MNTPTFEVVERPKTVGTRSSEPNPYLEAVTKMRTDGKADQAVAFTIPAGTASKVNRKSKDKSGKETVKEVTVYADVEKAKRLLRDAGTANDCTVRSTVALNDKKDTATVTFWTVDKIVRKDKDSESAPPAESEVESPAAPTSDK